MAKSKCKDIHQTSNLPSILETYQSPIDVKKAEDSDQPCQRDRLGHGRSGDTGPKAGGQGRKQVGRGCGVRGHDDKSTVGSELDQEAIIKRQALLDKRHLVVYRCMYRLRDGLYHRYSALLREKVHAQRLEMQRLAEAQALTQDKHTQKQRKLTRSTLFHDNSFLRSLPKSSYYLIQDVQNLLSQHGCLRSIQDHEQLWRAVHDHKLRPAQLYRRVQEIRRTVIGCHSAPDMRQMKMLGPHTEEKGPLDEIDLPEIHLGERLSEIHLGERHPEIHLEESLPEIHLGERHPEIHLGEMCAAYHLCGKQQPEQDDIEQRILKVKVPRFAALQTSFLKNLKTDTSPVVVEAIPEKSKKSEMAIRKLRHMHTLSLTNMAVSQRLLTHRDRHTLYCSDQGRSVRDLMQHVIPSVHADEKKRRTNDWNFSTLRPLPHHEWTRISSDSEVHRVGSALERTGLERTGLERPGLERPGLERSGLERSGLERSDVERLCRGCSILARSHLEKPGLERPGLEKSGLEKSGLERSDLRLRTTLTAGDTETRIKAPEPLCMEEVCQQNPSMVIGCGSTLWRNYYGNETAY
ncbi:uncharacterized protein si:ch211-130h14.4 isoform X2 [Esox lucius]|uniref:uncharacterized protein si:ch211-130h14.4 isoform X2 n=1 Tax=Esox lucius TaxID=8010 RepID=UPI0014778529|nr:uncharacterized protein si:ch211-130h14.4 isoform X2 [Esox lucius]